MTGPKRVTLPVVYINLASRPDRRLFMEEQFARLGVEATRLEAVTPTTLDPYWYAETLRPPHTGWVSPAELACSLSHRLAWRHAIDNDAGAVIVLEDDAQLAPGFGEIVALNWPIGNPDILRFETRFRPMLLGRDRSPLGGPIEARQMLSHEAGTAGYVISRDAAIRLIDDPMLAVLAVDKLLFGRAGPALRQLDIAHTVVGYCVPVDFLDPNHAAAQSDIASVRQARGATRRRKTLRIRLSRLATNLRLSVSDFARIVRTRSLLRMQRLPIPFPVDDNRGGR